MNLTIFLFQCFVPISWAPVYNERVPYCVYIQMGLGNTRCRHSCRVQTHSLPAYCKCTQTTVKTSHTHTHTQHLCPWVLQYFKIAAKWEKRPLSLPQWAYSEAAPKATYLPKYVSTFLICIIYYGQNQNREHSQGQYYVLALWLLLNRTPVSWIHTNTHSRTISDTCLHTRFAPTGPLPEKHGCYGKRTTIQSLFTQH